MTTLLVLIVVVLLAVALWQLTKIFDLTQVGANVNNTQVANDNDNNLNFRYEGTYGSFSENTWKGP